MTEDLGKIRYESLHSIAYDKILNALRQGKFAAGESLRTRTLAKALGVSSTPVRDALSRLIAQNALDVDPRNRAAKVPHLTRELLDEHYEVATVLIAIAIEAAAKNISSEDLEHIEALAEELDAMEPASDAEAFVEAPDFVAKSEEFFFTIFRAAKKPLVLELLDNLWLRSAIILGLLSKRRPKGFSITMHRHRIMDALAKGDPKEARKAMTDGLMMTKQMVLALMALDEEASADAAAAKKPASRRRKS